jgi:hypothetical protein
VSSSRATAVATHRTVRVTVLSCLALALSLTATTAAALASPPAGARPFLRPLPAAGPVAQGPVCAGTPEAPGVLAGRYLGNVTIAGECVVDGGQAVVEGNLIVSEGAALIAAFGSNDLTHSGSSRLTVHGNVRVLGGASLLMGCEPGYFTCLDDPGPEPGTLSSKDHVYGNLIEREPLGVVVHASTINGNVMESGGGGGVNCTPQGVFSSFPVYSDYEDTTVGGRVMIKELDSCWLGLARDHINGKLDLIADQLADPDAIEILANRIQGNLNCREDSQVWDNAETSEEGLFPRAPEPNTVFGKRFGQCVYSSPETEGGPLGSSPF